MLRHRLNHRHRVTIQVDEQTDDLLKRVTLLHTALLKVLQGTRLVKVEQTDHAAGRITLIVEAENIRPSIAPGNVSVYIDPAPRALVAV